MSLPATQMTRLRRRAFWLEYATMTWMVAEAAIAITAGVIAASIALVGFGLDSVLELFSAGIVIWQLRGEIAGQDRQTRAIRLIGVTFFVLAAYLAAQSIRDLAAAAARPGQSVTGLAVTAAFRMRVFNIGGEGQLYVGAMAAAGVGLALGSKPAALVVLQPFLHLRQLLRPALAEPHPAEGVVEQVKRLQEVP